MYEMYKCINVVRFISSYRRLANSIPLSNISRRDIYYGNLTYDNLIACHKNCIFINLGDSTKEKCVKCIY